MDNNQPPKRSILDPMVQPRMKWRNLKDMKCPKCGLILRQATLLEGYQCSWNGCNFTINIGKFTEVVRSLYEKKPKEEEEDYQNNY